MKNMILVAPLFVWCLGAVLAIIAVIVGVRAGMDANQQKTMVLTGLIYLSPSIILMGLMWLGMAQKAFSFLQAS